MAEPYADNQEYLRDALALLALQLHREVALARLLRAPGTDESFLGLFLSDGELDAVLAGLHGVTLPQDERTVGLEAERARLAAHIDERLTATVVPLRHRLLADAFGLSLAEVQLTLLLLAPEVDRRFGRVYAYLQDDVTRRWLSPGLALRLLCAAAAPDATSPSAADDPAGRALFGTGSPLVREGLVQIGDGGEGPTPPLLDRPLKLDDRIVEYLLEHDALDARLVGWAHLVKDAPALDDVPLDPALRSQVEHLSALWHRSPTMPALFWGRAGGGQADVAAALARELGRDLLAVDGAALARRAPEEVCDLLQAAVREARLRRALLYVEKVDALDERAREDLLTRPCPGRILSARTYWPLDGLAEPPLVIPFPIPSHELRRQVWRATLGKDALGEGDLAAELAGRFRLMPGQIAQAAHMAQQRAWLRDGPESRLERDDLFEGCRLQSNPALDRLATKIVSPYTWHDLVLPEAQMASLRAIESYVRHAHLVYQVWGFGAKLSLGKGLTALFSGPSGTGKTMAAGILARSLGLDMFKIDLSGVVSKYIGETEKNLSRIFEEADTANAILFFDEADALFGKRSEVKDAHDRYANIEISYLLQRMEEYEGVAILATNLERNLDEAFTRRMQFVIEFPFPQALERERIWRGLFPAEAPRSTELDFPFLAERFELAGGNIKNCVLAAAFLAAEDGGTISMSHVVQGVARELAKLGRPLTRTHFGDYYPAVRQNDRTG